MTPSAADAGTWQLGEREVRRMGFGSMRLTVDPDPQLAHRVLRRAVDWQVGLPALIADHVRDGDLRLGASYTGGSVSFVARATTRDGVEAALWHADRSEVDRGANKMAEAATLARILP